MIYLVALLVGVTIMNNIDRTLLPMLVEPIRRDLLLSDTQIGELTGVIFAVVYTLAAIPISLLADRFGRPLVLSACVTFWSIATAFSGATTSFLTMAMARVGIATGEAGGTPIAQAIVSQHVPKSLRTRVLSILGASVSVGSMAGLVVGGALGQAIGWRATFFVMGAPGVVIGLLLLGAAPRSRGAPPVKTAPAQRGAILSFLTLAKVLFSQPAFCMLSAAAVFCIMGVTAMTAWKVALVMRAFHMPLAQVGLLLGLAVGVAGVVGNLLGGQLSSNAERPDIRKSACLVALGGAAFVVSAISPSWPMMLTFLVLGGVLSNVFYAPVYSAIQWIVPEAARSQASAIVLVLVGAFGISIGPTAVGLISDMWAGRLGVGSLRLGVALTSSTIIVGALAMLLAAGMLDKLAAKGRPDGP